MTVRAGGAGAPATCDLRVDGMDCASCAATVERAVRGVPGVHQVSVDVVGGRARIGYDPAISARADIAAAIRRAGYQAQDAADQDAPERTSSVLRKGRLVMAIVSGVALALGLVAALIDAPRAMALAFLGVATLTGGWYVAPRGIRAALARSLDMNFLMTAAAAGAWIIGEPEEAAATLFLFAIAELLESYSMDRARNAIRALMDLSPAEATVRRDGVEASVPIAQVAVGETVLVRPGERIAVDGQVIAGQSSVNQAAITGESMPVDKEAGAEVFAGSLNGHGALEVRSSKPANDTTLARIIHAVEEAQGSRAPSQTFVERFARVYTPAVVAVALLIAVLPPVAGIGSWETWIYRALAMLVVACPCALVISTPVTIVSGLTGAASAGILVKGGKHLENLGGVTVLMIDKTGTLTLGEPRVVEVRPAPGMEVDVLLARAAGVERHSEHPLAHAVVEHARARGVQPEESSRFQALVGRGARATVKGPDGDVEVYAGNAGLARELGALSPEIEAVIATDSAAGRTAILVVERTSIDARLLGTIVVADEPRQEAIAAIADLRTVGVRRIIMLTGDNAGAAQSVARAIGVDEVHAELLPEDKLRHVREMEADGSRVVFVGDGINDGPALAAATVGVSLSAAGTDVALEAADVALMGDDLRLVAAAVRRSRRTRRIIKQNIAFSLAVKAVFLVLAVSGWATLWMAVAADMGGSLLVVSNGLRARHEGG